MGKIFFLFFSVLCLISCDKENDSDSNNTNYIRLKIDGVSKAYNHMAEATILPNTGTGIVMFSVHGNLNANTTAPEGINLVINSSKPIAVGTYREDDPSLEYTIGAVHGVGFNDIWSSGLNPNPTSPFKITISSITSTRVTGTFSGTVYNEHGMGNLQKQITEGEFSVNLKQ